MSRPSRSHKSLNSHQALAWMLTCAGLTLSACAPPATTSYRLLSDEVISQVKSPPYSREQVRQAQASLRWRIAHRIRDVSIQSELKSFACLIISQRLDPTSARGERAPSRVPCISNPKKLCSHGCKRSRISRDMRLPAEYDEVARRHDEILWTDLQAIAPREASPPWERYLTDCLACQRSAEVKRLICERDLKGVDLTEERTPYTPLDRWLNQCETLSDPKIQALVAYRASMLTPAEDLPYPAVIPHLSAELQASLSARAMIGEGERLAVSSLDSVRITALLSSDDAKTIDDARWVTLRDQLKRRLDVELMPCLERGMEACLVAGQVRLTLKQAPHYLRACGLCEYQEVVREWLDQVALGLDPVWHSHRELSTQVLLKQRGVPALITREVGLVSRLKLGRDIPAKERLTWHRDMTADVKRGDLKLWEPQPRWAAAGRRRAPYLLFSDHRQLYALDPRDGATRWSYRFPFSQDGELVPCERVEPIPAEALGGRLSQGGALCYRRESMLFLNAYGEPTLNLNCDPALGCGQVLALTADDPNPYKAKLALTMEHPERTETGDLKGVTLTTYDLSELDGMTSEVEEREPQERSGQLWSDVLDVSWAMDRTLPSLLVATSEKRGVSLRLIDASSGQERWRRSISGQRLLQAPSVRVTQGVDERGALSLVGVLTRRGLTLISLSSGEIIRAERLPLRGRVTSVNIQLARRQQVSWELLDDQLTLLHPLNRSLYTSARGAPLKSRELPLKNLDARANLSLLHGQWVVTSPAQGEVFGVTPRGDRVAWTWKVQPFTSLEIGPRWALFRRSSAQQLSAIFPLSTEELARLDQSTSQSPCALGDRWGCVIAGDQLLNLDARQDIKARSGLIRAWFQAERARRISSQRTSTSLMGPPAPSLPSRSDALQAQSLWGGACAWGIAGACTRVGMLAELGLFSHELGVPADGIPSTRDALRYYRRAEQLGDTLASERLGEMYEEGVGEQRNYQLARASYHRACEGSWPHACARWGRLNELGLGGPQRRATAFAAYQKACKAQVRWACDLIKSDR